MEDINNLNVLPGYSIDDSIGRLNQFSKAGAFIAFDDSTGKRECGELITALENAINDSMGHRFFRFCRDSSMNGRQRP